MNVCAPSKMNMHAYTQMLPPEGTYTYSKQNMNGHKSGMFRRVSWGHQDINPQ